MTPRDSEPHDPSGTAGQESIAFIACRVRFQDAGSAVAVERCTVCRSAVSTCVGWSLAFWDQVPAALREKVIWARTPSRLDSVCGP